MRVPAPLQNQNLATLLALLAPDGRLAAGRLVEARLLSVADDGTATAQIGDTRISLVLSGPEARQTPLQPGSTLVLQLQAQTGQQGSALTATLVEARPPTVPPSTVPAPAQPAAPPAPSQTQPVAVPVAASAPPQAQPAAPLPPATTTAPAAAPPLHNPIAPAALLPAVLVTGRTAPTTTAASVPTGLDPAQPAQPTQPIGPGHLQTGTGRTPPQPGQPLMQQAPSTAASPRTMAGPLLGEALARQDSIGPLFANLRAVRDGTVPLALPRPLLAMADRLLAQALPVDRRPVTAAALKQAVSGSGLFLEARDAAAPPAPGTPDLKAGLLALKDALAPLVDALAGKPGQATTALARPDQQPQPGTDPGSRPATPRRDGPLAPQPLAEPSLQASDTPATIASTLLDQTESALDRLTLSQYASLPPEAARAEQGQRWHVEIPLAFAQGTAVLPLAVERDPPHRDAPEGTPPLWRVRFALDLEPLGPMQGVVTLRDGEVGVTFWAEREETSRLLRGAAPGLETALLKADFAQGRVDIHTGRPATAQATAGQFLDRMS